MRNFTHTSTMHPKHKRGFTLVEMIVAIATTAVLLGIGIPFVGGYIVSSEMIELNQNAKTIYLVAQDYLTQATAGGGLDAINETAQKVTNPGDILPAIGTEEMKDNKDNLVFLRISKSGDDDAALTAMLTPYLNDPNILEQSVLVEYNKNTGVVRSVLYSKKAPALDYTGQITDHGNVLDRNEEPLRQKRQGYYGVDYTGNLKNAAAFAATNPKLVNSDRLTLEWDDTTPTTGDWKDFLTFTVIVYSEDYSTEYLRLENVPNPSAQLLHYPTTKAQSEQKLVALDTYWRGALQTDTDKRQHAISVRPGDAPGAPQKMVLILDDIHRAIYETYPTIPIGNLRATVEPSAEWVKVPPGQTKEVAHSYFASEKKDAGKDTYTYQIEYARQLNNIRHAAPTCNYNISKTTEGAARTIDWSTPETKQDANNAVVNFEVINFQYRTYAADGTPTEVEDIGGYRGTFSSDNTATLSNMIIAKPSETHLKQYKLTYNFKQNYGVFAKLAKGATIKNIKLNNLKLNTTNVDQSKNFSYVGALAGQAVEATLINVRVENGASIVVANSVAAITEQEKNAYVGGVLGYAEKCTMDKLYNAASVQSGSYLSQKVQNGRDCVGGLIGAMQGGTLTNSGNASQSTANVFGGNNVGGIVGRNDGGTISSPQNTGKYVVGLVNVGGIVGYNERGTVIGAKASYAALNADNELVNVFKELKPPTILEGNLLKFPVNFVGVLGQENVGGIIGNNGVGGTLSGFITKQKVKGGGNVGGVVGKNAGAMTWTNESKTSEGIVICAGSYAGGILGMNTNSGVKLDNLVNKSHVVAKEYAGGIIGSNGDAEGDTGQRNATTISNCQNAGAVFAYKQYGGGIAGRNLGNIKNCSSLAGNAEDLDKKLTVAGIAYGNYVGGITGYNNGEITECKNANLVKGNDFVGGITGHNDAKGYIFNCTTTGGRVIGIGNFVGGFIGLNTSDQLASGDKAMGGLHNLATLVKGKQFVGGVIGCNLFAQGNLTIQASSGYEKLGIEDAKQTIVEGEAYVGGIIGYNCMMLDFNNLPNPEAVDRPGTYNGSGATPSNVTKLMLCKNYGQVKTLRYGGGIIGLNSPESALVILQSENRGLVAYANYSEGNVDAQKSYYIAGITGRNTRTGVIDDCINSGKIMSRSKYTGGLVEVNEGLMKNCKNAGQVLAEQSNYVGGIAGYNITAGTVAQGRDQKATLRDCITTDSGRVSGVNYVGGIVGANAAVLEHCTLTGSIDYATEAFHVSGTGDCVGGITGFNQTSGILDTCGTSGGSVRGRNFVGGIVGYTNSGAGLSGKKSGLITTYTTNGSRVYGEYFVGGITGVLAQGISALEYCANSEYGRVIGYGTRSDGSMTLTLEERDNGNNDIQTILTFDLSEMGVGGILGVVRATDTIKNAYNDGVVVGAGAQTGGITGLNLGTVEACINRGVVKGSSQASNLAIRDELNTIRNDKDKVGGIVGRNLGNLLSCVADANVTRATGGNNTSLVAGRYDVGGIVGALEQGAVTEPKVQSTAVQVTGFGRTGGLLGSWAQTAATLTITDKKVAATVTGTSVGQTFMPSVVNEITVGGVFGQIDSDPSATAAAPVLIASDYTFAGVAKLDTTANWQYVGGIVPKLGETQSIQHCALTGTVSSAVAATENTGAGGIVGENAGRVEDCTLEASARILGDSKLGGIIGENAVQGTMLRCLNKNGAVINGLGSMIGGYMGRNQNPTALVRNATTDSENANRLVNAAQVIGGKSAGGIVGDQTGNMTACDNRGNVQVYKYYGGGIAGRLSASASESFTAQDCVNYGEILLLNIGTENDGGTGGVVGLMDIAPNVAYPLVIFNCHNEGNIEAPNVRPNTTIQVFARYVGGVVGQVRSGGVVKSSTNKATGSIVYFPGNGLYTGTGAVSTVGGAGVGGVVGLATSASRVESCENLGTLTLKMEQPKNAAGNDKESISPEGVAFGGVVGSLTKGSVAVTCKNSGTLTIDANNKYHGIGGVVGSAFSAIAGAPSGTILNCTNESPIMGAMSYSVGGVLGLSSGALVEGCINRADVSARGQVGGIVGGLYRDTFNVMQNNTIKNSINYGKITNNPKNLAKDVNAIGGILGAVVANESYLAIDGCTNEGAIQIRTTANGTFNGAGGILGETSFGPRDARRIQVLNSKNTGKVVSLTAGRKVGIGGIVGNAIYPVLVQNCVNTGEITDDGKGTYESVGGIVGNVEDKKSWVVNCKNHAAITATNGNAYGSAVGGIVGRNQGIVASSVNAPLPGAPVSGIRGRDGVGGIVGMNNKNTAFIYSTPDLIGATNVTTINEMAVEAINGDAGGIAGKNLGGGVVDAFNTGNVTATAAAGGIIGIATTFFEGTPPVAQAAGQVANACSIGGVTGQAGATGGVIGERQRAYDSTISHNIKQTFYLYEDGANIARPPLSVGNEPDESQTIAPEDEPRAGAGTSRRLSTELFEDNGIIAPDFTDIAALRTAIAALQAKVSYHLEQPRKVTVGTESTQGYWYTTSWEMVQGLVDHYEVYLRKKGETSEEIGAYDIKIGDSKKDAINSRLETFLTFNINTVYQKNQAAFARIYGTTIEKFDDLIGCEFDIVVKTISAQSGIQTGPQDSFGRTSEENRKILPVLPTPKTKQRLALDKVYALTIEQLLYVPVLDSAKYKNLGNGPDGLYMMPQWSGVSQYRFQNKGAKNDAWQNTSIAPSSEAAQYKFNIDHSTDFVDTTNPQRNIQVQALSSDTKNGYASSEIYQFSYKVQVRLNPPTNIQARFNGTNAVASYLLTWNQVANNRGYNVQVQYMNSLGEIQTATIAVAQNATQCTWTVPPDIAIGTQAAFTVTALGENGLAPETENQIYITSLPSNPPTPITLPVKLTPPSITFAQGAERDTDFTVNWTTKDTAALISNYVLSIKRYPIGGDMANAEDYTFGVGDQSSVKIEPSQNSYIFQFAEADFNYNYLITMRAEGMQEKSLTSADETKTFALYPRRTTPSAVTAVRTVKTEFEFTWDEKAEADAQYPAAELAGTYQLCFSKVGESTAVATISVATAEALKNGFPYIFTEENGFVMGQQYQVELMALAVDGVYSRSKNSKALQFFLPKAMAPVQGLQVKAQPEMDITKPRDITTYDKVKYTASWDAYDTTQQALLAQTGSFAIKIYSMEAGVETDITDVVTWDTVQTALNPSATAIVFHGLSAQYAGKKLTFKVVAVAGAQTMDSPSAETEITVPKAKLEAPNVKSVTQDSLGNPSQKDVTIALDTAQTALLQSIVEWRTRILHYTINMNLVYDAPVQDAGGKQTTEEKTLAFPVEITTFIDEITNPAQVAALTNFICMQDDLLLEIQKIYPEILAVPTIKATSNATIFLTAVKTEKSGFTHSDGTDSTEDLPEGASFLLSEPQQATQMPPPVEAPAKQPAPDMSTSPQVDASENQSTSTVVPPADTSASEGHTSEGADAEQETPATSDASTGDSTTQPTGAPRPDNDASRVAYEGASLS